jgi:DNA-binding response OmpR family regulator
MKVILLEDDQLITLCTRDALVEAGFEVLTATGGEQALRLLTDSPGCLLMMIDVRVDDRLDGWEVARRARQAHPDMAIVYTTTADTLAYQRESVDRSVLLQKPYTLDRAVNAALEACRLVE